MPVFDGLEILQINSFRRLQWDLFVKLPNDRARTMSFRGHTVQTVDARSLVGHVVGFRSQQGALNPVIGFALIRLATPELVWNPACYYSVRIEFHGDAWAEGAVMKELINFSSVHYAVIEALRTETGPERFVIAYPNEQSLRDVIAAPSIIAFGFPSREEAIANTEACFSAAAA